MARTKTLYLLMAAVLLASFTAITRGAEIERLWTIGTQDDSGAEFAMGPNQYSSYSADGFFVIGKSKPREQWPYVQPGPDDSWAGGRRHTFDIAFGLDAIPPSGNCELLVDLVDTQNAIPPRLRIDINGRSFEHATPRGAGDASVYGEPSKGHEHKFVIQFPVTLLRHGTNHIGITTLSGSWILYDCVGLDAPAGCQLCEPQGTFVRDVHTAPVLVQRQGKLFQTVTVDMLHLGENGPATIRVSGAAPVQFQLQPGSLSAEIPVPAVDTPTEVTVQVLAHDTVLASEKLELKPVRKWVVYLLPHSHVDIGYTHVQTDVEHSHWRYYEQAIAAAHKTADYPPGHNSSGTLKFCGPPTAI